MAEEAALSLPVSQNLRLVALDPKQLQNSQQQLIAWCAGKMTQMEVEVSELTTNLDIATNSHWNTSRPKAALRNAKGRLNFYEKIRDALEAGFFIIPNFPCDIFAIRTEKDGPEFTQKYIDNYSRNYGVNDSRSELPVSGEGEYVNPAPIHSTYSHKTTKEGKDIVENTLVVEGWKESVDFPFVLAKPEVLTATQRAMALKIFDEMGVCPQTKKSDPLVVGIIKAPKNGHSQKQVSFLVAWFLDTETL